MRTAIVILTRNAVESGKWEMVLQAVSAQEGTFERKIIVDSSSDDQTCPLAESHGFECRKINRKDFNHGTTRDRIVRILEKEGIDTVVFFSQDVIPATCDAVIKLTEFLWSHPIAGCCGKQISQQGETLDAWQRGKCYPSESRIKTLQDVSCLGLMTPFFSNAFSAWKTKEVIRYGGFPKTDFGEDMLLAAAVLNCNGAIGYCADAAVFHEHSSSPGALFLRGRQIGRFHREHPELLRQFGKKLPAASAGVPCSLWFPFAFKIAGYLTGRFFS